MRKRQYFDAGVWWTEGDELHLDIPRLLAACRLEDTQENRDLAIKIALEVARTEMPGIPIILT